MYEHSEYVQNGFDCAIQCHILIAGTISAVELGLEHSRYESDDMLVGQMFVALLVAGHIVEHVDYLFLLNEKNETVTM